MSVEEDSRTQDKVETVARALCRLDGKDPDRITGLAGGSPGFQHFGGEAIDGPSPWTTYKAEAERFVVAMEALRSLLDTKE